MLEKCIMTAGLTVVEKTALKAGSKVVTTVGGCLLGYGVSSLVIPKMKKPMEKYMRSKKFAKKSPEQKKKAINQYNMKACVVNGLCASAGSVVALLADTAINDAINSSAFVGGSGYII